MSSTSSTVDSTFHAACFRSSASTGYQPLGGEAHRPATSKGSIKRWTSCTKAAVWLLETPAVARLSNASLAGPNRGSGGSRKDWAKGGFPSRRTVSEKLAAAKERSETARKASKLFMLA